ncbi:MAG: lysylphosphatidylglycerol synthase domain-containing protein [Myxococcota bacterium]
MRAVAPWIFAAILVAALFQRIPFKAVVAAAQQANAPLFIAVVFSGAVTWFLLDTLAYRFLFSVTSLKGNRLSARQARSLRGMTYLLAPIHWNVGQAAVALRLKMRHQVPLLEGASSLLLYQLLSLFALSILGVTGLLFWPLIRGQEATTSAFPLTSTALPYALAITFSLASGIAGAYLALRRDLPGWPLLRRVQQAPLFAAFRTTRIRDLLILSLIKIAYQTVFAGVFFCGLHAFGVEIPLTVVLIATPFIQIAGGLPITPAGLGTQQAAMIYFFAGAFGEAGNEAAVAAFAFSFPFLLLLMRGGIGLSYLPDLQRERIIQRGREDAGSAGTTGAAGTADAERRSAKRPETRSA